VIAIDTGEPKRAAILRLLSNWKISIEITGQVEAEEELMMALTQAYLEWEQQTEQRGRQEGIAEGEQRGKLEGEQSVILRQLARRIGNVTPEQRDQIRSLSIYQLEALAEALLGFSQPDELTNWLHTNQG
jgi:predicted transposase YdaD